MATHQMPQNLISNSNADNLRNWLPEITNLVRSKLLLDMAAADAEALARNPALLDETIAYFGELLPAVYEMNIPRALTHEFASLRYTLGKRGYSDSFFAKFLQAWIIGINSTLEPTVTQEITPWLNQLLGRLPYLSAAACPVFDPLSTEQNAFLEFLLAREKQKAKDYLVGMVKPGRIPLAIVEQVMVPALCRVGLLWQEGSITVADEHAATNICRYLAYSLLDLMPQKKRRNQSAFLCCVPGEEHDLALEILAGALERNGWRVSFIGRSTPQPDLVKAIKEENPRVIFLSVTLVTHLPAAKDLIVELKLQNPNSAVVLGGFGVLFARDSFTDVTQIANQLSDGLAFAQKLEKEHA
jgi:MerR family transcriptional regulator, light-induced transcriptional regulator